MKFEFEEKEYYIDGYLASQLNSMVYNIDADWDFVILITGDRMVRVGKSVFAMTIGAYFGAALKNLKLNDKAYSIHEIYFDSANMVNEALEKSKYYVNHYDEARESLAASKSLQKTQQNIIDFFNECGQLNHIFILVLPDFFTLKEDIAIARSECLINVYRTETKHMKDLYKTGEKTPVVKFNRGQFQFFNRKKKEKLYDMAKTTKRKSYSGVKADFIGRFTNQWTIDREKYEAVKKDSLNRFKARHKKEDIKTSREVRQFLEIAEFLTPKQMEEMSLKLDRSGDYFRKAIVNSKKKLEVSGDDKKFIKLEEKGQNDDFS